MPKPSSPASQTGADRPQLASAVLGRDHPLTRACDALEGALRQLLVVAAVLVGSVLAAIEHNAWARSIALAAAIVLAGVAAVSALLAQSRRERAIDVILQGQELLPVGAVARQRRRLAARRTRRALARTLVRMTDETLRRTPGSPRSARPVLHRPLIAAAAGEIQALAAALRDDRAAVRGVAFSERLITRSDSPLYGRDLAALRAELRRARELLRGR
jgi:hypothetical protein